MGKRGRSKRDWAGLPEELVTIIGEKASTTNTGYVHLRLVCKAWRRALTPNPRHLPPQAPWLMFPRIPGDVCRREGFDHSKLTFCDFFQSKTHSFQFPYIAGKYICGSSHGWLVLELDRRVSLFNPITRNVIDLPSLDASPTLLKPVPSDREEQSTYRQYVMKATLSCNPSEDGCVVAAWFLPSSDWELGFCLIGDTRWTGLRMRDVCRMLMDFTCHKNLVYAVDGKKEVSIYDLQDLSVRKFSSKISYNSVYDRINLVKGDSESGEPLVVKTTLYLGRTKFFVYRWFDDKWHRVRNIGNQVLFLNLRHSISLQLEDGRENELYYDVRRSRAIGSFRMSINRVYLESGKDIPQNPNPIEVFPSMCGYPLWVTPSLI